MQSNLCRRNRFRFFIFHPSSLVQDRLARSENQVGTQFETLDKNVMRREIIYQTVIQDSSGKIIFQNQEDSKHAFQQLRNLKRGFYRLIRYTPKAILMQTIHKKQ